MLFVFLSISLVIVVAGLVRRFLLPRLCVLVLVIRHRLIVLVVAVVCVVFIIVHLLDMVSVLIVMVVVLVIVLVMCDHGILPRCYWYCYCDHSSSS